MSEDQERLHRFAHKAMGTIFEIIIAGEDAQYARQAAAAAFHEVDLLEGLLSRFDPSSEVCRVNRLAPGQAIVVAPDLFENLWVAREIHERTKGAFDVTIGSLIDGRRNSQGPPVEVSARERRNAVRRMGMMRLRLDRGNLIVELLPVKKQNDQGGGIYLDLGGIGKGYAIDRGVETLREWGIEVALMHSGTSTAFALGSPESTAGKKGSGEGWVVGAGAEWDQAAGFGAVRLLNEALSGSGKRVKGEHIVNPRTGFPTRKHVAAWAIAPSAAVADALSTAFMVMSTSEVVELCKKMPGVEGLVVGTHTGILGTSKDEIIATAGFRSRNAAAGACERSSLR